MCYWWSDRISCVATPIFNYVFTRRRTGAPDIGIGKTLINRPTLDLPTTQAPIVPQIQVEMMRTPSIPGNGLPSMEVSLFNQIAMFSAGGLVMSMALVIVGGLRILHPWF